MKRRPSAATVIASVALFFSLTGAGLAAQHYLITSKRQIAPWVRAALRGERGEQGPRGLAGQAGAGGAQGPTGTQGPANTIDWSRAYLVQSGMGQMTTVAPQASETAACNPADQVVSGGYDGSSDLVTTDAPWPNRIPLATPGSNAWLVQATLAPAANGGTVRAWAICIPTA